VQGFEVSKYANLEERHKLATRRVEKENGCLGDSLLSRQLVEKDGY